MLHDTAYVWLHCRWYHGKIERKMAEDLLHPREDGLFLIRESVNYPGDYTLSVCYQRKVEHYRIIYHKNQMTIDEETYFDNLNQLVEVFFFLIFLKTSKVLYLMELDLFHPLCSCALRCKQSIYTWEKLCCNFMALEFVSGQVVIEIPLFNW